MALNDFIKDVEDQLSALFKVPEAYDLSPFSVRELRNSLIFEMIKTAYDRFEPKDSLRSHRGTDEDSARMQDSRNKAYVQYYRDLQYKELLQQGWEEPDLLPKDVSSMEGRLDGHKMSEIQYYEMDALSRHPLLKAIVSKRICDVKKISNTTFCEYMQDYDEWVVSLAAMLDGDDDDVVFATTELFTLEWKYCVDLFYWCAVEAEKNGFPEPDKLKMVAVCADVTMPQPLNPLLLTPYEKRDFKSHAVPAEVYKGTGGMEVSSKKLCQLIAQLHHWDMDHSYRVPGNVNAEHQVLIFELTKAEVIEHE